jgi:FKBP-type peptidyl-prolyl cis-trans isomerase
MHRIATAVCLLGLLINVTVAQDKTANKTDPAKKQTKKADPVFKTVKDKASYAFGLNIGNSFNREGFDLNFDLLVKGLSDALNKAEPKLSDEEIREAMNAFQAELRVKQAAKRKAEAEKNKKTGAAFLAKNKKQKGVITTKSGLQYQILIAGKGKSPKKTDTVKTHYRGTLIDGTEFDSSYKRNQPATFGVSGVIKGWTEALQLMRVGAKWKLFIPSDLAYGENPRPGSPIGPNAVLVFEIELLSIED